MTDWRTLLAAERVVRIASVVRACGPPRAAVGSIAHSTARASREPIAPVVISRPRPMASGGSLRRHEASPISDGWRQARSCRGTGAGGVALVIRAPLRPRAGHVSDTFGGVAGRALLRAGAPVRPWWLTATMGRRASTRPRRRVAGAHRRSAGRRRGLRVVRPRRLRGRRAVQRHRARPRVDERPSAGVGHLTYEAYEEQVVRQAGRASSPSCAGAGRMTGRVVLWHRVGRIELGESSVVVVVAAPHRPEAFEAARFAIDAMKASAPIWKHEEWDDGADWGTGRSGRWPPPRWRRRPRSGA